MRGVVWRGETWRDDQLACAIAMGYARMSERRMRRKLGGKG